MTLPGMPFAETKDLDVPIAERFIMQVSKRSFGCCMCYKAHCCKARGSPIAVRDEAHSLTILCHFAEMRAKKVAHVVLS
jgi:hypothetical protein